MEPELIVEMGVRSCLSELLEEAVNGLDSFQNHLVGGRHVGLGNCLRGIHFDDVHVGFVALHELGVHLALELRFERGPLLK